MKSIALFCFFLAFFCQLALAVPRITVVSPTDLAVKFEGDENNGIPFSVGNFGKIPYGTHIIGVTAMANPADGCDTISDFRAGEYSFDKNVIAVIRTGNCPFTIKTRNAQAAGAKVVIIVQENDDPLPASFGVGSNTEGITIPTVLISKKEGDQLIKFIEKLPFPPVNENFAPIVIINFPYDTLTDNVKLDFWFSASDSSVSYNFLNYFSYYALSNPDAFKFTPHFVTWDCLICKSLGYGQEFSGDCISGGRYCAPDPDDEGPLTGADIIYEDLRQACIWQNSQQTWWEYASYYATRCLTDKSQQNIDQTPEDCSYQILENVASSDQIAKIKKCVEDSFIPQDGKVKKEICDNTILAAERQLQLQYDISEFPVLLINHKPYDGDLEDLNPTLSAVCSKIKGAPAQCESFIKSSKPRDHTRHHVGISMTLVVVLFMAALIVFYCYRRITKRKLGQELSIEANNMVSRYMSLKDLGVEPTKDADEETVN